MESNNYSSELDFVNGQIEYKTQHLLALIDETFPKSEVSRLATEAETTELADLNYVAGLFYTVGNGIITTPELVNKANIEAKRVREQKNLIEQVERELEYLKQVYKNW